MTEIQFSKIIILIAGGAFIVSAFLFQNSTILLVGAVYQCTGLIIHTIGEKV